MLSLIVGRSKSFQQYMEQDESALDPSIGCLATYYRRSNHMAVDSAIDIVRLCRFELLAYDLAGIDLLFGRSDFERFSLE